MDALEQLFAAFKIEAEVIHNGQYCGDWAVDTSGSHLLPFHLVTHGQCYLSVDGDIDNEVLLHQGDLVIFPRDIEHCLSNTSRYCGEKNLATSASYDDGVMQDSTGLVCGYFAHHHPLFNTLTHQLPVSIVLRAEEYQNTPVDMIFRALIAESESPARGSSLILAKLAEALLLLILRDHLPASDGVLAAFIHPKLSRAMGAIHNAPQQKWTVEELAGVCHMSRAAFSELFKSVVGQSPMDYVTQWRLALAYRMLADERVPTLQAALACGYDNESSFSKAFKRVMGASPGAIRAGQLAGHTADKVH